jgi:uncharacterized protein YkwD
MCSITVKSYEKTGDAVDVTYEIAYDLYDMAGNETQQTTEWNVNYSDMEPEELAKIAPYNEESFAEEHPEELSRQMVGNSNLIGNAGEELAADTESETQDGEIGYMRSMAQSVYEATNEIRAENNLPALQWSNTMLEYSDRRAVEIITNWSHDSAGGAWNVGENLAQGYPTVDEVMEAWMNSPDHRINILCGYYKSISVSVYYDGYSYYWVQNFDIK